MASNDIETRIPCVLRMGSVKEIVSQSSPVDCEAEEISQLYRMGLVHRQGIQASLACELFRPFFCDRLSLPRL